MRVYFVSAVCGAALLSGVASSGCSEDTTQSNPIGGYAQGGAGGQGSTHLCGSANGSLDSNAVTLLKHDNGTAYQYMRQLNLALGADAQWVVNDQPLYEAVRFSLQHPARIHGFEVMWANMPAAATPETELTAGLYADFGYNGFDFWAPDPLWQGSRCAQDVDDSGQRWTRYTFDEPVVIKDPGLVYVAHLAQPGEPVWWWDNTVQQLGDNPCTAFDNCQSAINLPQADLASFFNGISSPFEYHFMVRLYVEYSDDLQPADKVFQALETGPEGSRHVSFVDYDKDGYDDLFLQGALWHNNGEGTFTNVTASAGLDGLVATGGVWGDYDNDGCLDLFAFSENAALPNTLWHNNCDGSFGNATAASNIVSTQTSEECGTAGNTEAPTAAAAWVDIDADGWLDLYLANHICWSAKPTETYYVDNVWHNNGDGSFTSLTASHGFTNIKFPGRNVSPIDHDGDGDVDILVGSYRLHANLFFENLGGGLVKNNALALGLAGEATSLGSATFYGHTIGSAWGDLDNDGDFDVILANLAHPRFFTISDKTQVLLNDGTGHYTDLAGDAQAPQGGAGLRYQETYSVPTLLDANNDGILDLVLSAVYDGRPNDFYWGTGNGSFTLDSYHAGITTTNGWGMAAADFDHDGDVDLFSERVFRNDIPNQNKGHWLQVHVTGATANNAAIGSTVRVTTGTTTRMRHVQGGTGKGGQDSLYLHFGLATATTVDEISVTFPGGHTVTFAGPFAVDQRLFVKEDVASPVAAWAPPF